MDFYECRLIRRRDGCDTFLIRLVLSIDRPRNVTPPTFCVSAVSRAANVLRNANLPDANHSAIDTSGTHKK